MDISLSVSKSVCRWFCWAVASATVLWIPGCGDPAEDSRQQMHKIQLALMEHAEANGGEWPERLDTVSDNLKGGDAIFRELLKNPVTGDDPGYEYVKPEGKLDGPGFDSQQVILYQLRDGKRDTSLKVGYADGSVRPLGSN